jgi:hypothetical protein
MLKGTVRLTAGLAMGLGLMVAASGTARGGQGQPIAFNHKAHVSQGLDCASCHRYVREQPFATLPTIETCLMCHSSKMSENPEEAKIREFAKRGEPLHWQRLYVLSPDAAAYFSHRRHVALGDIACATCHGPMAEQTQPPRKALVRFDMDFCIACHQQKKVSTTCVDCHR